MKVFACITSYDRFDACLGSIRTKAYKSLERAFLAGKEKAYDFNNKEVRYNVLTLLIEDAYGYFEEHPIYKIYEDYEKVIL